ncbi:MAG: hypothetical protein JJU13_13615 [Balneolaceae bacterium]|nr:hypothetical protein [Balneolaceae bacterium]
MILHIQVCPDEVGSKMFFVVGVAVFFQKGNISGNLTIGFDLDHEVLGTFKERVGQIILDNAVLKVKQLIGFV